MNVETSTRGGGLESVPKKVHISFDIFFKNVSQHQSKSSETCSDTFLILIGTSSTTYFMIMIGFEQKIVFFEKFGLESVPTLPPPGGGVAGPTYGHEPKEA